MPRTPLHIFLLLLTSLTVSAQDTIFLGTDTIRVGNLEWNMQKDWRESKPILTMKRELYGDSVRIFIGFHENKTVEEITFGYQDPNSEFIPHGPCRYYYEDGKLLGKRWYEHGDIQGKALDFYPSGALKSKTSYREGVIEGDFVSYYENGITDQGGKLKNGKENGRFVSYYSNGQKKQATHYVDGVPFGTDTCYYENGNIQQAGNYQDGFLDGELKLFHRNGNPWALRIYDMECLMEVKWIRNDEGRTLEIGSFADGNGQLNIYDENSLLIAKEKYRRGFLRKRKEVKR